MDPLLNLLGQLGLDLATSAVYDFLKTIVEKPTPHQQIANEIQNCINMCGVSVKAETIINVLAQNGFLTINKSQLHANEGLVFGSSLQSKAIFGNNSSMTTNKTAIIAGSNAFIETNGNAQIRHNPDGSISFHVG